MSARVDTGKTAGKTARLGDSLSPSAIRDIVRAYARRLDPRLSDLAPHDLRRTHARLAREGGASLETVQHSLGHSSLVTTERYLNSTAAANAGEYIDMDSNVSGASGGTKMMKGDGSK